MYFLSNLLIVALGFLYPAYKCYKAIKSNDNEQLTHWTLYWVVMATFYSVSKIADIFISWLPLYYEAKVLFTIYIMVPQTKGAAYLYVSFLQPFLDAHEEEIDLRLNNFKAFIRGTILNWAKVIMDSFKGNIFDLIIKAQAYVFNSDKKIPQVEDKIYPTKSPTHVTLPKKEETAPVPAPTITINDSIEKSGISDPVTTGVENIKGVKATPSDSKTYTPPPTPNLEDSTDEKDKKSASTSTPVKTSTTAAKAIRSASTGRTGSPAPTTTTTRNDRANSTGADKLVSTDKQTTDKKGSTKKITSNTTSKND